jgi:hypothetical protein
MSAEVECEFADRERNFCRRWESFGLELCEHCRSDADGLFAAKMDALKAQRDLTTRLAGDGDRFPCDRYGLEAVDALFCAECRRNPVLKQILGTRRAAVRGPCLHRGEQAGEAEVPCCGGKMRLVPTYRCAVHAEPRTDRDCIRCANYASREAPKAAPVGCVSWESLWQVHQGQTALVLACGPSVLLPGEDPSPDTVDPRTVEADVVVSVNWAWKWYGDICDYQVSYDPTPCLGWRPAHIKLLTVVRGRAAMSQLERCQPYCLFPGCDYGEIGRGKPLPCSRNSGYAALAFAAYAGCATIKVLGMDFGPRLGSDGKPARMHFYPESDFDVQRRVKSFARNRARVQGDLKKLLSAVRAAGAVVENLSEGSVLSWAGA